MLLAFVCARLLVTHCFFSVLSVCQAWYAAAKDGEPEGKWEVGESADKMAKDCVLGKVQWADDQQLVLGKKAMDEVRKMVGKAMDEERLVQKQKALTVEKQKEGKKKKTAAKLSLDHDVHARFFVVLPALAGPHSPTYSCPLCRRNRAIHACFLQVSTPQMGSFPLLTWSSCSCRTFITEWRWHGTLGTTSSGRAGKSHRACIVLCGRKRGLKLRSKLVMCPADGRVRRCCRFDKH